MYSVRRGAKCHSCAKGILEAETGLLALSVVCPTGIMTKNSPMFLCMTCFEGVFPKAAPKADIVIPQDDEKSEQEPEPETPTEPEAKKSDKKKGKKVERVAEENEATIENMDDDPSLVEELTA